LWTAFVPLAWKTSHPVFAGALLWYGPQMQLRVLRVVLIVLAGVAFGLAWNQWSGRGFPLHANALVKPGDPEDIKANEAKRRLDKGGSLFLDARPYPFYEMGHIPGSLSLPEDKFDEAFAKLEPRLRDALDVVVYCSGYGCEASHMVARQLKEHGVPAVVLSDGWPAWTDAKYPVKEGAQP
jgi:rhodanese-related sulfurtransferase